MPLQETIYQVASRVATITLNRPDKLNAWTATMEKEVRSSLEEAARDDGVRVIVLTGAGRGFCAGADMSLLTSVAAQALPGGERDAASLLGGAPHIARTSCPISRKSIPIFRASKSRSSRPSTVR